MSGTLPSSVPVSTLVPDPPEEMSIKLYTTESVAAYPPPSGPRVVLAQPSVADSRSANPATRKITIPTALDLCILVLWSCSRIRSFTMKSA